MALWALTLLFFLRILCQMLQLWLPQDFLPPFNAFQGSSLPYWILLPAQLAILTLMVRFSLCLQHSKLVPNRRTGLILAWMGGAYMAGSLGRICVGLVVPAAPPWFSTWIPAVFHVVLASFVLTLGVYHVRGSKPCAAKV